MFTHSLVSTVADNFIFPFIQYRTTDTNTLGDFTG
ncbi:hypothetical protein BvCmsKSP081_01935 [Escherichia coli]|nr:hypothetical protein BvCmsKSP081_01935 [Escherichia coli]